MQWTRDQILTYLKTYKTASAQELSGALNVTAANIRHHLQLLMEDGKVQERGKRRGKGPGRPQKLYGLTSRALEDNLQGLIRAVLDSVQKGTGDDKQRQEAYRHIARHLLGSREIKTAPPIDRLNEAVEQLNQLHYHASWEAHPTGPRVLFKHCPYRSLPRDYPGLCDMDAFLVSELTGQSMRLTQQRTWNGSNQTGCVFSPPPD